jgi:hypothetical protein
MLGVQTLDSVVRLARGAMVGRRPARGPSLEQAGAAGRRLGRASATLGGRPRFRFLAMTTPLRTFSLVVAQVSMSGVNDPDLVCRAMGERTEVVWVAGQHRCPPTRSARATTTASTADGARRSAALERSAAAARASGSSTGLTSQVRSRRSSW